MPRPKRPAFVPQLAACRRQLGLTQASVAATLRISVEMVRRHEQGKSFPKESTRDAYVELYGASRIELGLVPTGNAEHGELLPNLTEDCSNPHRHLPSLVVSTRVTISETVTESRVFYSGREHPVVPAIRSAVHEAVFIRPISEPGAASQLSTAVDLDSRVTKAWLLWHTSRAPRTEVGRLLPDLIWESHALVRALDGPERRIAQAAAGSLYRLVQRLLAHVAEPELHAVAVERGRAMSESSDLPNALALAAWSSAIAVSAMGYFDEAVRISEAGSQILSSQIEADNEEALGIHGALNLESAAAFGFAGHTDGSIRHLEMARSAATRLSINRWHTQSGFDRTSVALMSVIVDVANGKIEDAVHRAEQLDPALIPSRIRRSRFLLELAVAHVRLREPFAAIHYMRSAITECPEAVIPIPWAADVVHELVQIAPATLRSAASELEDRFTARRSLTATSSIADEVSPTQ